MAASTAAEKWQRASLGTCSYCLTAIHFVLSFAHLRLNRRLAMSQPRILAVMSVFILLLSSGCAKQGLSGSGKRRMIAATVTIKSDPYVTGPPDCYADNSWAILSNADTITWSNSLTSDVTISFTTSPLAGNANNFKVPYGGSTTPYQLDGNVVKACAKDPTGAACYFQYQIVNTAAVACEVQNVHYATGVHITPSGN
jgi:hypothetical protein